MISPIIMAINYGLFRNPFKDKRGRWKDDVSRKVQYLFENPLNNLKKTT